MKRTRMETRIRSATKTVNGFITWGESSLSLSIRMRNDRILDSLMNRGIFPFVSELCIIYESLRLKQCHFETIDPFEQHSAIRCQVDHSGLFKSFMFYFEILLLLISDIIHEARPGLKDIFRKSATGNRRKTGGESRLNYDMPLGVAEWSVESS